MNKINNKRMTIKESGYKIIYNQCNKTNQYYFVIVDKFNVDKRIGTSYICFKDAEKYLLDCGLIKDRSLFSIFESNIY